MILFKKWARHNVKTYLLWKSEKSVLLEKNNKKWNQERKQKQSSIFNFCNIFDFLNSRTQEITWWSPILKPDCYIFPYNEQLRKI